MVGGNLWVRRRYFGVLNFQIIVFITLLHNFGYKSYSFSGSNLNPCGKKLKTQRQKEAYIKQDIVNQMNDFLGTIRQNHLYFFGAPRF